MKPTACIRRCLLLPTLSLLAVLLFTYPGAASAAGLSRTAALLETYVKLKPDDFMGFTKLRQTYLLTGRPMDAAKVCRILIERDPSNPCRYVEAGILFEKLGIQDSVLSVYEEGLRVNPGFFPLHKRLGLWHQAIGNTGKASWHLRVADSLTRAMQASPRQGQER